MFYFFKSPSCLWPLVIRWSRIWLTSNSIIFPIFTGLMEILICTNLFFYYIIMECCIQMQQFQLEILPVFIPYSKIKDRPSLSR